MAAADRFGSSSDIDIPAILADKKLHPLYTFVCGI
jgi:hypothetical protein